MLAQTIAEILTAHNSAIQTKPRLLTAHNHAVSN